MLMIVKRRTGGWVAPVGLSQSSGIYGEVVPILFSTLDDAIQFLDQQGLDWGEGNHSTMRIDSYDVMQLSYRRFPPGDRRNREPALTLEPPQW